MTDKETKQFIESKGWTATRSNVKMFKKYSRRISLNKVNNEVVGDNVYFDFRENATFAYAQRVHRFFCEGKMLHLKRI